ncbi:MAG: hypothetical protein H7Z42_16745 [Roseiflexaceae bacterium]|nr:hypothetical protein [Roseiflexaceae bacterium]
MTGLSLLGVPIHLRPAALVSGVLSAVVVARLTQDHRTVLSIGAGLLWYTADCTHVVGHIFSSQAVGAPLDAVDFGLYPKSVYYENDVAPQQHIGRASGGVIASFTAALFCAFLATLVRHELIRKLITIAAVQHAILFVLSTLPIPIVDGGVILANIRKLHA